MQNVALFLVFLGSEWRSQFLHVSSPPFLLSISNVMLCVCKVATTPSEEIDG